MSNMTKTKRPTKKCQRCQRTIWLKKWASGSDAADWQHAGRNTSGVQCWYPVLPDWRDEA